MKNIILVIPTLLLGACASLNTSLYEVDKTTVKSRHIAYLKANHYCKSMGKYAFSYNDIDTATHYVYKCK